MELNRATSIGSPVNRPKTSFFDTEDRIGEIHYRTEQPKSEKYISSLNKDYIPCLFLPCLKGSKKLIIYFHGNAEDLGISYEMLDHMRTALRINVMAVEYPGYGIYEDENGPSEE